MRSWSSETGINLHSTLSFQFCLYQLLLSEHRLKIEIEMCVFIPGSKEGLFPARWCVQPAAGHWSVWLRPCSKPHLSTTHSTCVPGPSVKPCFHRWNTRSYYALYLSDAVYTSGTHSLVNCTQCTLPNTEVHVFAITACIAVETYRVWHKNIPLRKLTYLVNGII